MRLPRTTVSDVKDAFAQLIGWGRDDWYELTRTSRYEVFEDLYEGLRTLEPLAVDPPALECIAKARRAAQDAREYYRAGNFQGGILTIQEAHEHFLEARFRSKRGKPKPAPLL